MQLQLLPPSIEMGGNEAGSSGHAGGGTEHSPPPAVQKLDRKQKEHSLVCQRWVPRLLGVDLADFDANPQMGVG